MSYDYIKDIKEKIDLEIELNLRSLERLAQENDVELYYVLETYRNKMVYMISQMTK